MRPWWGVVFLVFLTGAFAREPLTGIRARTTPKLTAQLAGKNLELGDPVFVRIFKEERQLEIWMRPDGRGRFVLFKTYPVANWGGGTLGPKLAEGDGQAPEGFYYVPPSRMKPDSRFHLAFNLGYPNSYDKAHGRTGSFLMVHGDNVSIGCYAMTDQKIEEIYLLAEAALAGGQPFFRVHCFPFRMTRERLARATASGKPWIGFWQNLETGYRFFESSRVPPDVGVDPKTKRYTFR